MKLQGTFLRTRVARRVLLAFMLCALVPVALLSFIAYQNVETQLEQQANDRLREDAKSVGMMLVGRVAMLGTELRLVSSRLEARGRLAENEVGELGQTGGTAPRFRALEIERPDREAELLAGQSSHRLPRLPAAQLAHLDAGEMTLVTELGNGEPFVYLVDQVRLPDGTLARLWGEAAAEQIWGDPLTGGAVPSGTLLCLVDSARAPLSCGSPEARTALPKGQFSTGTFQWGERNSAFLAGYWTVFLGYEYAAPPWLIILSRPRATVLEPLASFRRTFLLVVLVSLVAVFLLSQVRIRQTMTPLDRLEEGTRRIARGDFSRPVQVTSGDEFETLGDSFNQMASELARRLEQLDALNWGALTALAKAIDAVSPWTAGHSERVTLGALEIGRRMSLEQADLDLLHRGGLLHDMGKIGVPASILDKPGALTPEERSIVERHTTQGAEILEPIEAFRPLIPLVLHHHESLDGTGYPGHLKGEQIPLLVRILTVSDVFDALASDRPYRPAWPKEKAIAFLQEGVHTRFDARVVKAFTEAVADGWAPSLALGPRLGRRQPLTRGGVEAQYGWMAPALEAQVVP
jgi:putative nucleotidyltransferase with HDIG domain